MVAVIGFAGIVVLFVLLAVAIKSVPKEQVKARMEQNAAADAREKVERIAAKEAAKSARAAKADTAAFLRARDYMEARLKAPKTADFAGYWDSTIENLGAGKYRVTSYVDSQNGFGALIRTRYTCHLQTNDGEDFLVTKLVTR
jgi:thioesterase domain-containing protein